jgi:hypothetical protein
MILDQQAQGPILLLHGRLSFRGAGVARGDP